MSMNAICLVILISLMTAGAGVSCEDSMQGRQRIWETNPEAQIHLCGRNLYEALYMICKGAYNGYDKKSIDSYSEIKNFEGPLYNPGNKDNKLKFFPDADNIMTRNMYHPRFKRNVVHECCATSCSYKDLVGYCYSLRH